MTIQLYGALFALLISLSLCGIIVLTKGVHLSITSGSADRSVVQAAHRSPTPRVGGAGIVVAVFFAVIFFLPSEDRSTWFLFLLSAGVIVATGLAEDLGFRVSPIVRLASAFVASGLCIAVTGVWIDHVGVSLVDVILSFSGFAILFTMFATSGVCNAFNLIDGINGLASGVGILACVAFFLIAREIGAEVVETVSMYTGFAILGFLLLNYPFGKIFLGDAGAYFVGFLLAWFPVLLMRASPEFSAWAVLLILFWPVADTALAVYRRAHLGRRTDQPDRMHFHQLVMRTLEIMYFGRSRRHVTNPLSTVILLPMAAMPTIAGVVFWNHPTAALLALILATVLFVATYLLGVRFAYKMAKRINGQLRNPMERDKQALQGNDAIVSGSFP